VAKVLLVDTSTAGEGSISPCPVSKKPATGPVASVHEAVQDLPTVMEFPYDYAPLKALCSLPLRFFIQFNQSLYSVLPTGYDPSKLSLSAEMKVAAERHMILRGHRRLLNLFQRHVP